MNNAQVKFDPGSFRDPSGRIFTREGVLYRTVTDSYKDNFEHASSSGLFKSLMEEGALVKHTEADIEIGDLKNVWKVIAPEKIPYISYPYEWCFSQLKDAALLTLHIQKKALEKNMTLKDASAFNIQFHKGRPVFIDTLSFDKYSEGLPWQGYKQFCEHFLAPLTLMSYGDVQLNQLMRIFIDGVPLKLASTLLPKKTYFKLSILSHIHLHAMGQKKYEGVHKKPNVKISKHNLLALIDNLESTIKSLSNRKQETEWGDYYQDTNYEDTSFEQKREIVGNWLETLKPRDVWDLGANDGEFSRLASRKNIPTIAFDIDPIAVEKNYLAVKKNGEKSLLPLILDVTNPSPSLGWADAERESFTSRGPVDVMLALALVHHLAISNNVPLEMIAKYFRSLCHTLIIEFVPIDDSQVQRLLTTRENIFHNYTESGFEKAFEEYFSVVEKKKIDGSERILYLMRKKV
jgi:ribosomal protein L11 methylase PrmA